MTSINQPKPSRSGYFDKRLARVGLFLVSVLIAILILPLADFVICDYLIFDYAEYFLQVLTFPVYLFSVLGSLLGVLIGWLIYLAISFSAIFLTGSGRLFWMLYVMFAFLLTANIGFVLMFTLSFGRSFGYTC